jgi:chorismate mutase
MTTVANQSTGPASTAQNEDAEQAIPMLREQIDALDTALLRIVAERVRVSQRIQIARMNAGGTRVELGRERVVLDAYREALGTEGATLADAVLRICRGAR